VDFFFAVLVLLTGLSAGGGWWIALDSWDVLLALSNELNVLQIVYAAAM
jgi:hypothetical protein